MGADVGEIPEVGEATGCLGRDCHWFVSHSDIESDAGLKASQLLPIASIQRQGYDGALVDAAW